MFKDLNEDDARAAMKAYAQAIADDNHIAVQNDPHILDGTNGIAEALRGNQFDMLSLTADEFVEMESQGLEGPLLVSRVDRSITEEYVLLVRAGSPFKRVEDLRGSHLILASDVRASLVPLWLEVLCREHGLGSASRVFASQTSATKAALVILPVFFGKADVCIATRKAWETMGELNPQVTNQLCAIATSPLVVPGMSCFHRGIPAALKQQLLTVAMASTEKPSFKQLMSLFKTEDLEVQPISVLDGTRQLVSRYHELCRPAARVTRAPNTPPSPVKEAAVK
jgi:phosphonate transport system substrate-binding protein